MDCDGVASPSQSGSTGFLGQRNRSARQAGTGLRVSPPASWATGTCPPSLRCQQGPNPGRYRILVETRTGRRRLYRPGDPCHPLRSVGKCVPHCSEIPPAYIELIDWYHARYVGENDRNVDPIVSLRGLGRTIWSDEQADIYVSRLREGW